MNDRRDRTAIEIGVMARLMRERGIDEESIAIVVGKHVVGRFAKADDRAEVPKRPI